ncbi:MAG: HlyD family secretion protein [Proteobacteria bacterium]|nr:HlyD family secretion protein [Pseudomonadota bacterium]MBU1585709.1 HlyD family secretion protein [Pseudomonadota bacterium]MBU2452603.1 HlyD family secretion protein [Pseudomonadota bacterium]MBU2630656.1 HlyD family secretion protein [Pseudomonadota bacterium]
MRFKLQFIFIDHILRIFLLLLAVLFTLILVLFWFFRMDITAKGEGKVICAEWEDVKPEIDGIIKNMEVIEGQEIKKGELLFVLEDRERKLETQSSLQKIVEIKKAISTIKQNISIRKQNVSSSIDEAKASLSGAQAGFRIMEKGPKDEEINLAQRSIKRAGQQVEKAVLDFDRMEKAFSLKLVSRQELDNSSHQKNIAQTDLALAKDQLALLLNRYDKDQQDTARAILEKQKAILEKAIARRKEIEILGQELIAAQKGLITEEKRMEALTKKLMLTQVTAPISGIIMTYDTKHLEGKAVSMGEVVLKIGGMNEYLIECKISEKDFPLVKPGQQARVTMKPFPRGEYKLFSAIVATTGTDSTSGGPSAGIGIEEKINALMNGPQALTENYYPVTLKLEKPYYILLFGNRYEVKPGFSAQVQIIVENERIATLLFKRVLRIKGKLTWDNIHL